MAHFHERSKARSILCKLCQKSAEHDLGLRLKLVETMQRKRLLFIMKQKSCLIGLIWGLLVIASPHDKHNKMMACEPELDLIFITLCTYGHT